MIRKLLFTFLFSFGTLWLAAQNIPAPPNPPRLVTDYTKTLTPGQVSQLEQKLVAFNDSTSNQIAVVIIPSLGGYPISDYAFKLGDKWGIGQKKKRNGVLLLISMQDREAFIAVGYGLEGAIPDAAASRIISNILVPAFKQKAYFRGIDQTTDALMKLSSGEYRPEKGDVTSQTAAHTGASDEAIIGGLIIAIVFFVLLFKYPRFMTFFLALLALFGNHRGGGRGSGRHGGGNNFGGFGGGSFGGGGAGGRW